MAGSAEPLPPPQQQQQQEEQQHTTYTSETEGDGEGGGEGDGEGRGASETEARTASAEPVAAPPAPPAALAAAAGPRGNKKASPPAAPECTPSLSAEPTDSQSTQSTVCVDAPPYRALAAVTPSSQGSVKIRRHCAGPNTAHLIPDVVDPRLRAEDWLCVPFNELAKQYKVQCTKCHFTFDITREAAESQYKLMDLEAGGHPLLKL